MTTTAAALSNDGAVAALVAVLLCDRDECDRA
jgi:hypothetical protein